MFPLTPVFISAFFCVHLSFRLQCFYPAAHSLLWRFQCSFSPVLTAALLLILIEQKFPNFCLLAICIFSYTVSTLISLHIGVFQLSISPLLTSSLLLVLNCTKGPELLYIRDTHFSLGIIPLLISFRLHCFHLHQSLLWRFLCPIQSLAYIVPTIIFEFTKGP